MATKKKGKKKRKGRAHLPRPKKKAIRKRLKQLCAKDKLDCTQDEFGELFDRSQRATEAWFKREGKNSVPEVDVFVSLARDHNVNLHWLLLGKGDWFREPPTPKGPNGPVVIQPSPQAPVAPLPTNELTQ